jgi:hypothetical protein
VAQLIWLLGCLETVILVQLLRRRRKFQVIISNLSTQPLIIMGNLIIVSLRSGDTLV